MKIYIFLFSLCLAEPREMSEFDFDFIEHNIINEQSYILKKINIKQKATKRRTIVSYWFYSWEEQRQEEKGKS